MAGVTYFSFLHSSQTDPTVYPASFPQGIGSCFNGDAASGRQADRSLPTNADVKNALSDTSVPHTS